MKRILLFEVFIVLTFAVRGSRYAGPDKSGFRRSHRARPRPRRPPPPPTQHPRSHFESPSNFSQYSQWDSRPSHNSSGFHYQQRPGHSQKERRGLEFSRYRSDWNRDDNTDTFSWESENYPQMLLQSKRYPLDDEYEDQLPYTSAATIPLSTTKVPPTTTAPEPFDVSDIKVPTAILRIEYMISFSFLGLMYGLGFLVLFQNLCVTTAKIAVYVVAYALIRAGIIEPYTIQQAMEQIPPQK